MDAKLTSSFRDPAGYVFERDGELYRQILPAGKEAFTHFQQSGIGEHLISQGKMAAFTVDGENELGPVLHLSRLPFVTYPYEWCFSQLKEAALLTIELMQEALSCEMILKDASAFNVAFHKCHPIFLDHTSFEIYHDGMPWRAYRQFTMQFIVPLLLMQKVDLRCLGLLREDIGGIPLDLGSHLLPWYTWLQPNSLLHIHLHALFEQKYSSDKASQKTSQLPKKRLLALLENIKGWLSSLKAPKQATEWAQYYNDNSYSKESFEYKKQAVMEFCSKEKVKRCIDLGANCGVFTQITAEHADTVIAADYDARAVEALFQLGKTQASNIQPMLLDLNNPSPDIGVLNNERDSFLKRTKADCVLGLALLHHLRISGNWSLGQIVSLFDRLAPRVLVEFVPLEDVQTQRLIRGREEIFQDWTLENLCKAFREKYSRFKVEVIPQSGRVLMAFER
ncbi:MAG: hypothetical protein IKP00_04515 [Victivallales bacterium]|nr:hypothetical protein [Victivallales bacterium]